MPGRTPILTEDIALELAEHLEDGLSIKDACALAGIGESTYHGWVKRGEAGEELFADFLALVTPARAKGRKHHAAVIRRAALEDWRASAWFLERSDPKQWGKAEDRPDAGGVQSGLVKALTSILGRHDTPKE